MLATGATAVLVAVGRHLPRAVARRLAAALALYGGAALGLETLNGWLRQRQHDLAYTLGTMAEETIEMLACIVAVTAILGRLNHLAVTTDSDTSTAE